VKIIIGFLAYIINNVYLCTQKDIVNHIIEVFLFIGGAVMVPPILLSPPCCPTLHLLEVAIGKEQNTILFISGCYNPINTSISIPCVLSVVLLSLLAYNYCYNLLK
jgi:hypothetical protein